MFALTTNRIRRNNEKVTVEITKSEYALIRKILLREVCTISDINDRKYCEWCVTTEEDGLEPCDTCPHNFVNQMTTDPLCVLLKKFGWDGMLPIE